MYTDRDIYTKMFPQNSKFKRNYRIFMKNPQNYRNVFAPKMSKTQKINEEEFGQSRLELSQFLEFKY